MNYALSYPAVNGETVTQGHADYCETNGHATHTVDNVQSTLCPRCGETMVDEPSDILRDSLAAVMVLRDRAAAHYTRVAEIEPDGIAYQVWQDLDRAYDELIRTQYWIREGLI